MLDSVNQDFNVEVFLNYLNSFDARIQFTVETQEGNEFSFLDIKLTMNSDGTISTSVFRKVSHTNLYSHYTSFSDLNSKRAVIAANSRRALNYCSSEVSLQHELKAIEDIAVANGCL